MNSLRPEPFIVAVDLHGTLINSNDAFIKAFLKINKNLDRISLEKRIYLKESRQNIAKELGINYSRVISEYSKQTRINQKMVKLIKIFKNIGVPVIVVTASKGRRAYIDRKYLLKYFLPDDFIINIKNAKIDNKFWENLRKKFDSTFILYIGNDFEEDNIKSRNVISLLNSEYCNTKIPILMASLNINGAV